MWKQKEYWVIGQIPSNKLYCFQMQQMSKFLNDQILTDRFVLNFKKWKNSRYHFSNWYSFIVHGVIRLLRGTKVSIRHWIGPVSAKSSSWCPSTHASQLLSVKRLHQAINSLIILIKVKLPTRYKESFLDWKKFRTSPMGNQKKD